MNESFENDFWLPYEKKVGKDKCITKYALLSPTEHLKIKVHVPGFVSRHRNKQYRPNPLSYLNGKMWLDESVGEKEEKEVYRLPKQRPLSSYKAKPYDRAKGIQHLRKKLKQSYEEDIFIKDWGGVYTKLLEDKCAMHVPSDVSTGINQMESLESFRIRNRFEEQYSGSLESNVRDKKLNWFLKSCRDKGRKIYKEI